MFVWDLKNGSCVYRLCLCLKMQVGTFSVKPIEEGGIFCSSNIPLLYKHYDGQSSSLVIKNLENLKGSLGEVQELAKYQQVRLVWSRSNFIEDSSMAEEQGSSPKTPTPPRPGNN